MKLWVVALVVAFTAFLSKNAFGVTYTTYSGSSLRTKTFEVCCNDFSHDGKRQLNPAGKNDDDDSGKQNIPELSDRDAKSFIQEKENPLLGRRRRGLIEECCNEGCSNEEIFEGSWQYTGSLKEECIVEGCTTEEIREHCYTNMK